MTYLALTGIINFLTCASLGVFVFIKDRRNVRNISYFCLNNSVALYSLGYFFWQISGAKVASILWFKVLVVGFILINISYLFFVFAFLKMLKKQKWFLIVCALMNLFFIIANLKGDFYQAFVEKYNFGYWPVPENQPE